MNCMYGIDDNLTTMSVALDSTNNDCDQYFEGKSPTFNSNSATEPS